MKLNSIFMTTAGYDPPTFPGSFCQTGELSEILLYDKSHHLASPIFGSLGYPLSDEGLRKLVDLCFFTSMAAEEGRFPRLKVVCQQKAADWFMVARFEPVSLESAENLRKLAPVCTHSDCALLIAERDGHLWCDGILNVGPMGYDTMPGRPTFHGASGQSGGLSLLISIEGPGHLIATSDVITAHELRSGVIRRLSSLRAVPQVRTLCESIGTILHNEVLQREGEEGKTLFGGGPETLPVSDALIRVLSSALDARHGGAFAFVPTQDKETKPFQIRLRYRASDLDIGRDLKDFWFASSDVWKKMKEDNALDGVRRWNVCKQKLLTNSVAAGNLASVDGCVVLNQRFQVCGFGGVIETSEEVARASPLSFRNFKTGDVWDYDDLVSSIGGTRHKSAARFCKANPNVAMFVISQDGELKGFFSSNDTVNAFGPLDLPFMGFW